MLVHFNARSRGFWLICGAFLLGYFVCERHITESKDDTFFSRLDFRGTKVELIMSDTVINQYN